MYQFSRAIYRELSPQIHPRNGCPGDGHADVLQACERTIESTAQHASIIATA